MIYTLAIVFAIIFVIAILLLVRNNKLQENYSILWIIFSIGIVVISIFPQIINSIAEFFGIIYQPSIIYLFCFIVLALYTIHLSIVLTKQNRMIIRLTQEIGILKLNMDKLKKDENEKIKKNEKVK